jgi:hypothetical protein
MSSPKNKQVNIRLPMAIYNRVVEEAKALNLTVTGYVTQRLGNGLDIQIGRLQAYEGARLLLAKLSQQERSEIMAFYCPVCWLPKEICGERCDP